MDPYKDYHEIAQYISKFTTDRLCINWVRYVEKNMPHQWDTHKHECHELMFNLGGKGTVSLDDGMVYNDLMEVVASDLIYFPPGVSHKGFSDLKLGKEMVVVHFDMLLEAEYPSYIKLKCRKSEYAWLFRSIAHEYRENKEYSSEIMKNYLANIILLLKRDFCHGTNDVTDIIDWSIQYMIDHIYDTVSITELANEVYMSISNYSKFFRSRVGVSPLQYFNKLKVEKAKEILISNPQHIGEVSEILGYKDPMYFSRVFKKNIGVSPKKFINNYYK